MQTNPKEKPNQTIDRNRKNEHKRRRCEKKQARKSTCKNQSIPHPMVSRLPGTQRLGFKSYGTGRSSNDDDDDDDDCAQQSFFPEVGGYEKPHKPPPGTMAVYTGRLPAVPSPSNTRI